MPAQEMYVWLRLKLLADVGLVGLPNAGKSTFINAVSNAGAKVGDYAFTTLVPKLGVVRHHNREFVLADIPGLIEGAAEGAGIGDRFLGHIERCRVLIHLIDIGGVDPAEAMRIVEDELAAYGGGLEDKPRLVALNKIDISGRELAGDYAKELKAAGAAQVFPVSGATGEGIPALLDAVLSYLPAKTATERPDGEVEDIAEEKPWSPL
jgi:GTP-binding protein